MYRVAICDDEKIILTELYEMTREILSEMGIDHSIRTFLSSKSLKNELNHNPHFFQILLLDVLMDQNGIDFAKELRSRGNNVSIVFVTGTQEYCFAGYDVHPMHYLLKPIQKEKLVQVFKQDYTQNFRMQRIPIPSKSGFQFLCVDQVLYIELLNRSLLYHTMDGIITAPGTFKKLDLLLPNDLFLRCHKSFLVNVNHIEGFTHDVFYLHAGHTAPIGRAYRLEALSFLMEHLQGN